MVRVYFVFSSIYIDFLGDVEDANFRIKRPRTYVTLVIFLYPYF